jgi:hypothetical protein
MAASGYALRGRESNFQCQSPPNPPSVLRAVPAEETPCGKSQEFGERFW